MTNTPIITINYPFDINELRRSFDNVKTQMSGYGDHHHGGVANWAIVRIEDTPYIKTIKQDLGIPNAKPRFYTLEKNASLPEHVDLNTKCSINVILSETDVAPIIIEDIEYQYTQCLLNTQRRHYVVNGPTERVLFKLSILDMEFEEVYQNILPYVV
jgi:hypothetical protein